MRLKLFYSFTLFVCIFFPLYDSHAFFGDDNISIVQDAKFFEENKKNIEDVLDDYNFCSDGTWYKKDFKQDIKYVIYRCEYSPEQRLVTALQNKHIVDKELIKNVIAKFKKDKFIKDLASDLLFYFKANAEKEEFKFSGLSYTYNGEEQAINSGEVSKYIDNIVNNRPIALPLSEQENKRLIYTLQKILLNSQKSYESTKIISENSDISQTDIKEVSLKANLNNFVFNDDLLSISASLSISISSMPPKIPDEGYFLKYFKAALAEQPKVLHKMTIPVALEVNARNPKAFNFVSVDKLALFSFNKNDLNVVEPKEIYIAYQQVAEKKLNNIIELNTKKTTKAQFVIEDIIGNYGYNYPGMEGSASIDAVEGHPNRVRLNVKTVNVKALHLCQYNGLCAFEDNKFICSIKNVPQGMENTFEMHALEDAFSIMSSPAFLCGARGFMHGDYSRCNDESSGPLSMLVIPVEIIDESDKFIVRFNDNGSESLDFISKEQAEFLENMIGKKVLVYYNQNQIWDSTRNFCKRSKEIIDIKDASQPAVKMLGGYSYLNGDVQGTAYIEPDFESKAIFKIHLNNYSKDLEKNCQFAGACYPEGNGFICKSFDEIASSKEFFEIIPTPEGFTVPVNSTNSCKYKNFMSGQYSKCEKTTFGIFSISGVLQEIIHDSFMFTTMELDSDGYKILIRLDNEQVSNAQSLIGKKLFVTYEDEQYWDLHDRTCIREKRLLSMQEIKKVQESLLGRFKHEAQNVQGSAIITSVQDNPEAFNLELLNIGDISQQKCTFSGMCVARGAGFVCQGFESDGKNKNILTLIPSEDGFNIPMHFESTCQMKGLKTGKYTKCIEKTLNSGAVTGVLTKLEEGELNNIVLNVQINDRQMQLYAPIQQLKVLKALLGKNVLVHYQDVQSWHEEQKLCFQLRTFTTIKEVK